MILFSRQIQRLLKIAVTFLLFDNLLGQQQEADFLSDPISVRQQANCNEDNKCYKYLYMATIINHRNENKTEQGTLHFYHQEALKKISMMLYIFQEKKIPTKTSNLITSFPETILLKETLTPELVFSTKFHWEVYRYKGIGGIITPLRIDTGLITLLDLLQNHDFFGSLIHSPTNLKIEIDQFVNLTIVSTAPIKGHVFESIMFTILFAIGCALTFFSFVMTCINWNNPKKSTLGYIIPYNLQWMALLRILIQYYSLSLIWICFAQMFFCGVFDLLNILTHSSVYKDRWRTHKTLLAGILVLNLIPFVYILYTADLDLLPFYILLTSTGFAADVFIFPKVPDFFQSFYQSIAYTVPIWIYAYGEFFISVHKGQQLSDIRWIFYVSGVFTSGLIIGGTVILKNYLEFNEFGPFRQKHSEEQQGIIQMSSSLPNSIIGLN